MSWQKVFIRKNCDVMTFCGVINTAYVEICKIMKRRDQYLFGHFKDKHFTYYINDIDPNFIGRKLYQRYFNNPQKIITAYKKGLIFLKNSEHITKKLKNKIDNNINANNLLLAFKQFKKSFDFVNFHYSIMPWWALEAWQFDFNELINDLIKKNKLENQAEEIKYSLLKPWKNTAVVEVGNELSKGVVIEKLVNKYQFLRSWTVVWNKLIDIEWIRSTVQESNKSQLTKKQIVLLLKPNKKQNQFIDLVPYIIFFKDWRDDLRRKHVYYWNFIFSSIAKYFSVDYDDLGYLTSEEIILSLKNNKWPKELITQRKGKEFVLTILPKKSKIKIIHGVIKKYNKAMKSEKIDRQIDFVKGVVAQTGVVRGLVRIIKNHHDIKRIEKGDVLIANTTHPNYLQGMKKAIAFVTDEGGIASHAAIVAREFKKPCIVGTKIATQVFKDGDMVEVDANNGIIRKL